MKASSQNVLEMYDAFKPDNKAPLSVPKACSADPFIALEFDTVVAVVEVP